MTAMITRIGLGAVAAAVCLGPFQIPAGAAEHHHHEGHEMTFDATGMVMNENANTLPEGCTSIGREYEFTVHAGAEYADARVGNVFGMSQHEYAVDGCSKVTVTLVNHDQVRHQWMVHGLPRYLYDGGMFHLEAAGSHQQTGTFIVPPEAATYLVHCDLAQHMEKGMKGQLKVAGGNGDLWAVPSVSGPFVGHQTPDRLVNPRWTLGLLVAFAAGAIGATLWLRRANR